jgi:hypothetical protein
VVNVLKSQYKTVDKAEESMGIDYGDVSDKDDEIDECSVSNLLSKSKSLASSDLSSLCESLFEEMMLRESIPMPGRDFIPLSLRAMRRLAQSNKSNVVYKLAKVIAIERPDSSEPLLPMDRMPWGLLQYQIDFFACSHINQVTKYKYKYKYKFDLVDVFVTCLFTLLPLLLLLLCCYVIVIYHCYLFGLPKVTLSALAFGSI